MRENKNTLDRRNFLKLGGILGAGTALGYTLPQIGKLYSDKENTSKASNMPEWRMIIDVNKCKSGCTDCESACRSENNVHPNLNWIRNATFTREFPGGKKIAVSAPILCNQCDNPPCALVCPVEATFIRPDKVVDVDKHRCIGCRYCVIGCPYDVRLFNFEEHTGTMTSKDINPIHPKRMHGVAESCNFCAHKLDEKKNPACVDACKEKAMVFGNTKDPNSEVSKLLAQLEKSKQIPKGLREDLGTKPKVLYIGL